MEVPRLVCSSTFPIVLVSFVVLLTSLLTINPTNACKFLPPDVRKEETIKLYLYILVFSQDHFINLKFNRNLFYDVSRECSLEGKFEAVINRTHPAYLLKLDGKDKTVFSHQVQK